MGYEVKYFYHPRNESGGYDTEKREEKLIKIGKDFEDISLDKLASSIMSYLARRDIWVVDVNVFEFVKKEISFKESKDGKGINLKNKKYSFNESSKLICSEIEQEVSIQSNYQAATPSFIPPINRRVLHKVFFDPPIQYSNEISRLKFTQDQQYDVYEIIEHSSKKIDMQRIKLKDDTGREVVTDEKYFTKVGAGLLGDKELDFSGRGKSKQSSGLSYTDNDYDSFQMPQLR